MPELDRRDDVQVLHLGEDENRFTPDWIVAVAGLLDEAVATGLPLVSVGAGRHYSSGLDLAWLQANPTAYQSYLSDVHHLLARVLTLPLPTIAAVNGHAFAAGAMLAMCHDQRVMRGDRGWWCLPEVDLGLPFTRGMDALLRATLLPDVARVAMTTGHRYPAEEALAARIVDEVAAEDQVLPRALARATAVGARPPDVVARIKDRMHADVVAALHGD